MKKIITSSIALLLTNVVLSQGIMQIHRNDGNTNTLPLTAIDSITFANQNQVVCPASVTDFDGNTYNVIQIEMQCWLKENLRVTHYNNGDSMSNVTDATQWNSITSGAYCNYNNDTNTAITYGRLYNWWAVADSRNVCPSGWHIPSDSIWISLTGYLGGENSIGGKMKETGISHWQNPNTGATNETGFTALAGGYRDYYGSYYYLGYVACWWSSTGIFTNNAWYRLISFDFKDILRNFNYRETGFSLRCIKN